ncbi:MAG: TIGR03118 family protein [Planctomycetota bacterium]
MLGLAVCSAAGALAGKAYRQANLVSDVDSEAKFTDPNLINPWGILVDGDQVVTALAGTGMIAIYGPHRFDDPQYINVPPTGGASPTGLVQNTTNDFVISGSGGSAPARYLVATEEGTLAGWNETVDSVNAIQVADRSSANAIYKGLALGNNVAGSFLFATDFHNNRVDVFDRTFALVNSFTDTSLPQGYAPFGIQNISGDLYVTFALQDADAEDEVAGEGLGFVDVFDTNGDLIRHLAMQGTLNAPWGLALAPDDFGGFRGAVLVGNFGDGRINGFDQLDGTFLGRLKSKRKHLIGIEGLWGIAFAPEPPEGDPPDTLFFAAGIDDEAHGLLGRLRPRGP